MSHTVCKHCWLNGKHVRGTCAMMIRIQHTTTCNTWHKASSGQARTVQGSIAMRPLRESQLSSACCCTHNCITQPTQSRFPVLAQSIGTPPGTLPARAAFLPLQQASSLLGERSLSGSLTALGAGSLLGHGAQHVGQRDDADGLALPIDDIHTVQVLAHQSLRGGVRQGHELFGRVDGAHHVGNWAQGGVTCLQRQQRQRHGWQPFH